MSIVLASIALAVALFAVVRQEIAIQRLELMVLAAEIDLGRIRARNARHEAVKAAVIAERHKVRREQRDRGQGGSIPHD